MELFYYEPIRANPVLGTTKGGVVIMNMNDASLGGNISMDSLAVTLYGGTNKRNICNQALSFIIGDTAGTDTEDELRVTWSVGSPTCVHGQRDYPWAGDEGAGAVNYVRNFLAYKQAGATINQFRLGQYQHTTKALQLLEKLGLTKMQFKNLVALFAYI